VLALVDSILLLAFLISHFLQLELARMKVLSMVFWMGHVADAGLYDCK